MDKIPKTKVGIFMSLGIGLNIWKRNGSLERELAIYKFYASQGTKTAIFSYDNCIESKVFSNNDWAVLSLIPRILPRKLYWIYALFMPLLFYTKGSELNVLKTNQASSGWPAILCGKIWRKKVVARCGYVYGESAEKRGFRGIKVNIIRFLEKLTFNKADVCFVPTQHLKGWIVENYAVNQEKVIIVPNYVDVDLFRPHPEKVPNKQPKILMIGRLVEVKRVDLAINSMKNKKWQLMVIGTGPLKGQLEARAKKLNVSIHFLGSLENRKIPSHLNHSDIFFICSLFEGHPKAVIEAMACGCVCVGTDSPGIREVIRHLETGLICPSEPDAIQSAIQMLLSDKDLRMKLSQNARDFAVKNYSLSSVGRIELQTIRKLIGNKS